MAEKTSVKTSVKFYRQNTEAEKQKMKVYAKKMKTNVKSLQADTKKLAGSFKVAALKMREDGVNNINKKTGEFINKIKLQIKENKEATGRMADNVKFFQSEVNKKRKDFRAYARGPFNDYIKSFWG